MSFFKKIFKRDKQSLFPSTDFGRYSDTYKTDEEFDCWDRAVSSFEQGKFVDSIARLLEFLSIPGQNNVEWQQKKGVVQFDLWQGSRLVKGMADRTGLRAETRIIRSEEVPLGLMRHLLEINYSLKFSRFSLDEANTVCLICDTVASDSPPQKIYQSLREVAMEADRIDEELQSKFDGISILRHQSIRQLLPAEKKVKLHFVRQWASEVIRELSHGRLNTHIYPGGASFLLLDFLYRTDLLIRPEGRWKEQIRHCHEKYFGESNLEVTEKNKILLEFTQSMAHQKGMHLSKDLYRAPFTFGMTQPEGHRQFVEVYDSQMSEFEWYYESHYEAYAQAICGYIAGHCLYQYALPEPSRDLLVLYFRLTVPAFFQEFGYEDVFLGDIENGKKVVTAEVSRIISHYMPKFGGLEADLSQLRFDNMALFSVSFLGLIRNLQYRDF